MLLLKQIRILIWMWMWEPRIAKLIEWTKHDENEDMQVMCGMILARIHYDTSPIGQEQYKVEERA